ncbi:predicted protein [Pyrenophora tritici-repentis Pt-1C-BFP]|uniref:Uncharacterized protein n=1 Tax=Pyrenophora tritici-repentis (strain Pt-1C-BFP) TaxID=426418 RepID=B2WAK1_PYRTR|nr:uncharacterized protein PTRG_07314 [Pyrenophora tritici-repentis Pt-1C-BFP]EDU50233.1 predicted protein [Pyrenophora tritici-repentis Pt-1C-BFP]
MTIPERWVGFPLCKRVVAPRCPSLRHLVCLFVFDGETVNTRYDIDTSRIHPTRREKQIISKRHKLSDPQLKHILDVTVAAQQHRHHILDWTRDGSNSFSSRY